MKKKPIHRKYLGPLDVDLTKSLEGIGMKKKHSHEFIMGPRGKAAVCRCGAFKHGPNNTNPPIIGIPVK